MERLTVGVFLLKRGPTHKTEQVSIKTESSKKPAQTDKGKQPLESGPNIRVDIGDLTKWLNGAVLAVVVILLLATLSQCQDDTPEEKGTKTAQVAPTPRSESNMAQSRTEPMAPEVLEPLLHLLAFFDAAPLPMEILFEHQHVMPPSIQDIISSRETLLRALNTQTFPPPLDHMDGHLRFSYQHQEMMRHALKGSEKSWIQSGLRLMHAAFHDHPDTDESLRLVTQLAPHAYTLLGHAKVLGLSLMDMGGATLLQELGLFYASQNHPNEALEVYSHLEDLLQKAGGQEHAAALPPLYNRIGQILKQLGHHAEALGYHQRALTGLRRAKRPDAEAMISTRTHLGGLLLTMGETNKAMAQMQEALALARQSLPANDGRLQEIRRKVRFIQKQSALH